MANQSYREGRRDNAGSRNWNEIERDTHGRGDEDRYGRDRGDFRHPQQYDEDLDYSGGGYRSASFDEERGYGGQRYNRDESLRRERGGRGPFTENTQAGYGRYSQAGYADYGQSGPAHWSQDDGAREQRRGAHFGKGPKNYTRSDERIREDVNDRLMQDHELDATNIEVQVKDGEVTLSGTVEDRSARRRAEDCIEYVGGVKHIQNNIRIAESNEAAAGKRTKSGSQS